MSLVRGSACPDEHWLGFALCFALGRRVPHLEQRRLGRIRVAHPVLEPPLYHLEGQEVLSLLAKYPTQAVDVGFVELAVTRRCPLRHQQATALEETDLRDGDVWKLFAQQCQHVANCEIGTLPHWVLSLRSSRGRRA
jgi:hypothetical protein